MAPKLFSAITLKGVEFPNRIVVAPMCQYSAIDGLPNDWHRMHLGQYAVSGAGLVIAEATAVEPIGRITPGCLGLWNDEQEQVFKEIVDFFETWGDAVPGIQLGHAGRKASTRPPWEDRVRLDPDVDGWRTVGPSALAFGEDWFEPKEMDAADMARVIEAFRDAAIRSDRAGFKVLELHGAHGYLLSQFLSPIANRRTDEYGGALKNRMRFPLAVFDAVRAVWPENKVLGVRLSATDWDEPGITLDESVVVAGVLKARGCDFIDVSSGGNSGARPPVANTGPGYQVPLAERIKHDADVTTMAVGMIRDPHLAEDIVSSGKADFVMLARGMLYEPHWPMHAAHVLGGEVPYPNQYKRSHPGTWPKAFPELDESAD